jgi:hypothetical protein
MDVLLHRGKPFYSEIVLNILSKRAANVKFRGKISSFQQHACAANDADI